jgi:hypothetical protein
MLPVASYLRTIGRRFCAAALPLFAFAGPRLEASARGGQATDFPNKTERFVVPFALAGSTAEEFTKILLDAAKHPGSVIKKRRIIFE